ncbi:hypothetical protein BH23PLA1_BH23PLA1_11050 [soil metagenome]
MSERRTIRMALAVLTAGLIASSQASAQEPTVIHLSEPAGPIEAELHLRSTNTVININNLLGANRFYNAGYTGGGTIQANIEAGHIDFGHEALNHATTQITGTGALGSLDQHATWVGHALGGRVTAVAPNPLLQQGIGPDATLWSGAIATSFGPGLSFSLTAQSVATTYAPIIKTGVGPNNLKTADVFNSSWGFGDPTGFNFLAIGVDGLINDTGVVSVFSAGNSGANGPNTVGGIGAGYNSITVGALGSDTSSPVYNTRSGFSSFGPNHFVFATSPTSGFLIPFTVSQRAAVDISAPGQNLTLARIGTTNGYDGNLAGTSFSAPIVAGGASLVVDAGREIYNTAAAIDGRVVKAVLLNGADKTAGWNNGQTNVGGVVTTTQSLDYQVGAGRMNLDSTFDNYVNIANGGMAGTTDVAGLGSGDLGNVSAVGWDFGQVQFSGTTSNTYFIDTELIGGTEFTATLAWFADRISGSDANFSGVAEKHLADLDLEIFQFNNLIDRTILGNVARSISLYNVVEHLNFLLPSTGFYGIRVAHTGSHWNFTNFGAIETSELYGLAWSGTAVPEPGTIIMTLLGLSVSFGAMALRRRRNLAISTKMCA